MHSNERESSARGYCFTHTPDNPLMLGPMAGVTDRPFRLLCHEQGAGLVAMEMISANAIKYGSKKTEDMIRIDPAEHPVSLQLFGPDPETMEQAAAFVARYPYDVLDINMGCPMPKIVKNGEGSALMRDPERCRKIAEACVRAQDRPVTAKIRSGYSADKINAVEVAKALEEGGVSAIAVHPRTREQLYEGGADWSVIADVVRAVKIPVIGSGDVRSLADALRMQRETGCHYVMIARAARGNPWIFSEHEVSMNERIETILRHATMQIEDAGEYLGMRQMRKHAAWYMNGLPGAAKMRAEASNLTSFSDLEMLLDRWKTTYFSY